MLLTGCALGHSVAEQPCSSLGPVLAVNLLAGLAAFLWPPLFLVQDASFRCKQLYTGQMLTTTAEWRYMLLMPLCQATRMHVAALVGKMITYMICDSQSINPSQSCRCAVRSFCK